MTEVTMMGPRDIWIAELYRLFHEEKKGIREKYKSGRAIAWSCRIYVGHLQGVYEAAKDYRSGRATMKGNLGYWLGHAKIHRYDREIGQSIFVQNVSVVSRLMEE